METFSALLAISTGNSPVPGEIPAQRPVTQGFDVWYRRLNKDWVNNREAGDLRRYRAHYVIVMFTELAIPFYVFIRAFDCLRLIQQETVELTRVSRFLCGDVNVW